MPEYRSKATIVNAVQYVEHGKLVKGMCNSQSCYTSGNYRPHIHTVKSGQVVELKVGDFIIQDPDGVHTYRSEQDIFLANHEMVTREAKIYHADSPSSEFLENFIGAGTTGSVTCICGRTHFVSLENSMESYADYAEGQYKRLVEMADKFPEKYIESIDDAVSYGEFPGGVFVMGCRCNYATGYENFIRGYRAQIGDYYGTMLSEAKDELERMEKIHAYATGYPEKPEKP